MSRRPEGCANLMAAAGLLCCRDLFFGSYTRFRILTNARYNLIDLFPRSETRHLKGYTTYVSSLPRIFALLEPQITLLSQ